MELILVRHGDAAPAEGYADDALRPLTERGRGEQEAVARVLAASRLRPDRILSSPRLRALQTAEILSLGLGAPMPEEIRELDGGFDAEELVEILRGYDPALRVMCVGHEPDMSEWAGVLLAECGVRIAFAKGAALGLAFEGAPRLGAGVLQFFYRPKDLVPATLR